MGTVLEDARKGIVYSSVKNPQKNQKNDNEEKYEPVPLIGARHLQTLLYFILVFVAYGFRVTLSMVIVAMTDPTASSNPETPTYEWKDQSIVLSAFFWGYIIPQIFAGWAANRFGAKWFLITSIATCSILSILTSLTAAELGSKGLMISRAIQGFCQGFILPSVAHLLSQWVPHEERSRLGTFAYAANPFGTVIAMLVTGIISASWYGWPMVFYVYGGIGICWSTLFSIFGYDSPAVCPNISTAEKYYIENSLGHTDERPSHTTPWKAIFTSVPLWALFIAQCGNNYCFWTLLTQIPTYMNNVMEFDIKDNSLLSSLPYLTLWILSFFFGVASDFLINKKYLQQGTSRKIFNSIGMIGPAMALICLGFTRSDQNVQAVFYLIMAVGMNSACFCGWGVNHMDLSPNHAGTLMGITNGFGNIPGILAPLSVHYIVTNPDDTQQWRVIFFLAAGINIITAIIYDIFGSGDVQPWNEEPKKPGDISK